MYIIQNVVVFLSTDSYTKLKVWKAEAKPNFRHRPVSRRLFTRPPCKKVISNLHLQSV